MRPSARPLAACVRLAYAMLAVRLLSRFVDLMWRRIWIRVLSNLSVLFLDRLCRLAFCVLGQRNIPPAVLLFHSFFVIFEVAYPLEGLDLS